MEQQIKRSCILGVTQFLGDKTNLRSSSRILSFVVVLRGYLSSPLECHEF